MKLLSLHIDGFGKFHDLSLSFSEGMNVIYGKNEAGKSTLHNFLRVMLYGMGRKTGGRGDYHHYRPWQKDCRFAGELRFRYQGDAYLLKRDFSDGKGLPMLFRLPAGTEEQMPSHSLDQIPEAEDFLKKVLEDFPENRYRNTVSIGQLKTATGQEMVAELRSYLKRIEGSGSADLSAEHALTYLRELLAHCEEARVPEASRNYAMLIGEIRNLERELSQPKYHNLLPHYLSLREENEAHRKTLQTEKEELIRDTVQRRDQLNAAGFQTEAALSEKESSCESLFRSVSEYENRIRSQSSFSLLLKRIFSAASEREAERLQQEEKAKLSDILWQELGDRAITEENMGLLRQRLKTFAKNFESLHEKEDALSQLEEALSQSESEGRAYEAALTEQHELRTELEGKLTHLSNLKNRAEQLRHVLEENEALSQQIDALELSIETMTALSEKVRLSFGRYLNEEAGKLISEITDGAYHTVLIDDNFHIKLHTGDGDIPLSSVSSGTIDQIYLAVRLAAARLFLKEAKEMLPLSFDDSFALYDEKRLAATLRFIRKAYDGQILIFTCHTREADLLKAQEEDFQLILL